MLNTEISIIIISHNTRSHLQRCLKTVLAASKDLSVEIIVIDNASRDGSPGMVNLEFPHVRLFRNEVNSGFAAAVNQGGRNASGKYLILLNTDAWVEPDTIRLAYGKMEKLHKAGAGGGCVILPDGTPQPSGQLFPSLLNHFLSVSGLAYRFPKSYLCGRMNRTRAAISDMAVDWISGAFLIIRKSVFDELEGFDERFFIYYEETDFFLRMKKKGYEAWFWPQIKTIHEGGASFAHGHGVTRERWILRSRYLYFYKHHGKYIVWLVMAMGLFWHRLRAWRKKKDKVQREFSEIRCGLIIQAWHDTQGGRVSPPVPWS